MASSRAEPAAAPRLAEGAATPNAKPSGGLQSWLPLVVTLGVLPLVAYALTTFVLVPQMQKSLQGGAAEAPAKASPKAHGHGHGDTESASTEAAAGAGQRQTVTLNKMLVNVAGTMASRYLLSSMTLVGDSPDFASRVAKNEPQLRDLASGLMMMKTIANLEKPGARNLLRGELIAGFNTIMGNAPVQELYFTEFAIQ